MAIRAFDTSFGDTGLFVRAKVKNLTTGSSVFVSNVVMAEDEPGSYVGTIDVPDGSEYVAYPRVYTDGTFAVLDPGYPAASQVLHGNEPLSPPAIIGEEAVILVPEDDEETIIEGDCE